MQISLYIAFSLCGSPGIHLLFTHNLSSSTTSPHTCCLFIAMDCSASASGRALQQVLIFTRSESYGCPAYLSPCPYLAIILIPSLKANRLTQCRTDSLWRAVLIKGSSDGLCQGSQRNSLEEIPGKILQAHSPACRPW